MEPIYVTGHRNPDTDSIVSAMAYAALQNAIGERDARLHNRTNVRFQMGAPICPYFTCQGQYTISQMPAQAIRCNSFLKFSTEQKKCAEK